MMQFAAAHRPPSLRIKHHKIRIHPRRDPPLAILNATTFVAGANPTTLVSAVLNEQLQANVQEFQVQWAKEPGQSLAGNQLTGLQSLGIQSLDLNQTPAAEWNERHEPKTLASGALARNDSK